MEGSILFRSEILFSRSKNPGCFMKPDGSLPRTENQAMGVLNYEVAGEFPLKSAF
jgi:hypothetical protein